MSTQELRSGVEHRSGGLRSGAEWSIGGSERSSAAHGVEHRSGGLRSGAEHRSGGLRSGAEHRSGGLRSGAEWSIGASERKRWSGADPREDRSIGVQDFSS